MAVELEELLVPDADAWRAWLEANHPTSPGVWLVLHKKGGATTALDYAAALDEALCYGWIDGQARSRDSHTSLRRMTPRTARSKWSQRNVGHVARLEDAGKMSLAGRAAVESAKADGRWEAAYSGAANAVLPEDLSAAIAANPLAQATYNQLNSANRYAIIYRTTSVKTVVARQRNITRFVEMLARGEAPHPQKFAPHTPPR
ncbi:YdeI/OmpD-associated family protein [Pseudarthrobacter sp. J1738]|uniref:YdeI/OmpD-associated family protein n=1 Tax=unclassified Pseudarthrobacter TaxID=2647000 RepID=UPI003D2E73BF